MLADTPKNGEYLVAAYVLATIILVGYWVALWRRAKKVMHSVNGEEKT